MVIINDENGDKRYGITRDNEMCYEIVKWVPEHDAEKGGRNIKKGDKVDAKWISTGYYPSTFSYAIQMVIDMLTAEELSKGERGLKAAVEKVKDIRDYTLSQLEGAYLLVEKGE